MIQQIATLLSAFGLLGTAIGLLLTVHTLRANHDWNRRQFASKMIEDWNPRTSIHRKEIERIRPGLIDFDRSKHNYTELSKNEATDIYTAKHGTPEWELRFHFIELLNYLEYVSAAYYNGVADKLMIEESFREPFLMWNNILVNFISVFGERRGYTPAKPWGPYHDLAAQWSQQAPRQPRRQTDDVKQYT